MSTSTSFKDDLKDAVTVRTALLVLGVLLLQLAFIWSYAAAFHKPAPDSIPVVVVAPASVSPKIVSGLNSIHGQPLHATATSSLHDAMVQLRNRDVQGVFVPSLTGTNDTLIVQSATGPAGADATTTIMRSIDTSMHRTLTVTDTAKVRGSDYRSLTSFYLMIGWAIGGYLAASLLGMSFGARPANARRAGIRLGALAIYALASGVLGALMVGPILHALPNVWSTWWLGALLVFATGSFAMAMSVAFGTAGLGITFLVLTVLGNPSSGGPYPWALLPPFWKAIGPWLPNGAALDAIRSIVYVTSANILRDVLVVAAYAVGGMIITFAVVGLAKRSIAVLPGDDRPLVDAQGDRDPATATA